THGVAEPIGQLPAVHAGHAQIQKDGARQFGFGGEQRERLMSIGCKADPESLASKHLAIDLAQRGVILDDEHISPGGLGHCLNDSALPRRARAFGLRAWDYTALGEPGTAIASFSVRSSWMGSAPGSWVK